MKPRILDFGARPELSGTFSRMLAKMYWPADAFRITFPSSPGLNAEVNVFERLILRLLEQGTTRSEEALACETCLDKDFVRTVVRQLQDKGFLDASLRPDVESLQKLGLVTGQNGFETYATAIVFRERLGGQILPYIHVVSDSTPLRNAEYQDAEAINLWKFSEKRVSRPPKRSEIRVLLRSLSERAQLRGADMPQPSVGLVNVESRPETVLLQCSLMFEDFGRHVVTNPFGAGYSALLGDVLIQSRSKFLELNQVLESIESRFSRGGGDGKKSSEDRVPIETRKRYPRVADALRYDFLTAANVYDALEWALFYASCHAPIDDVLFMVEDAFRRDDLPKRLFDSALRTEFVLDRGDGRPIQFAPIRPGKILDFRAGKAEMNTVLAISIFQAAIHPDQAPFAKLARTMPDFFLKIQRLRQERNAQRHGGKRSGARRDTAEADWVITAIQTLLPDAVIRTDLAVSEEHTRGFHNRIAHRMRLQSRFGFSLFSRLTENQIVNLVVAAQNAEITLDDADRQPFATGVCAALESFLKNRIQSVDFRSNLAGDEFEVALSGRAKLLGLSDILSRPCFNLQTRNRKSAAAGNPASLGACILCFIAREDEDILRLLNNRNPRWLETVADLLDLRGHGNEARPLPKSRITQIRDEFLSLFQTLMETLPCH